MQGNDVMVTPKLRFKGFSSDWLATDLEKICSHFQSGKSITSKDISDSEKFPVYGGNGLRGFTDTFTHEGKFVLVGRQGALCGNVNLVDGQNYISEHAIAIQANTENSTDLLAYWLDKMNLNRFSEASAQPGLAVNKLVRFKIVLPTIEEQTKIASFLSAIDDKIVQLTQEHELLSEYKKGMMQQIFSQKLRFKADDGSDFEDWQDSNFEKAGIQIIDGDRGNNYPKSNDFYDQGFCLFLNAGNVTKSGFRFENTQFIDENKDSLLRKGRLKPEDIIITTRGTVGNIAYFDDSVVYENMRINSGMVIFRSNKIAMPIYLNQFLTSNIFEKWIEKNVFGSAQPQLTVKLLKSIPISLPSTEEQTKIANCLSAIDQKIDNIAAQIDQAKVWKKGLLQQMFV